ncbi:hypothetical protein B0H21DRAFT_755405 [Amylocystis lapponica]|nr:hypothetical protein B0H21DRAFT_755405 [Amylocystis lapponica]
MPQQLRPPLTELPLERFLPPASNADSSYSPSRPNKRPHSPGGSSLYSPAKRRILDEEGVFSPERKSPMSSASGRFAPLYFNALLQGPGSPVRKLEFGAAKPTVSATPVPAVAGTPRMTRSATVAAQKVQTTKLAPSPELSSKKGGSRSKATPLSVTHPAGPELKDPLRTRTSGAPVLTIPREVIPPDRQSTHYPGFDVFQEPYIIIPSTPFTTASESDAGSFTEDEDVDKENVRPPRRKKVNPADLADMAWAKAGLLSPSVKRKDAERSGKAMPFPATPKHMAAKERVKEVSVTPLARSMQLLQSPGSAYVNSSPGRTPMGKKEARKMLRKAMEEEVDALDDDDMEGL